MTKLEYLSTDPHPSLVKDRPTGQHISSTFISRHSFLAALHMNCTNTLAACPPCFASLEAKRHEHLRWEAARWEAASVHKSCLLWLQVNSGLGFSKNLAGTE